MNLDSLYRDAEVVTCEAVGARVILFLQASMQGATTYPILILNAERLCLTRTAADSQWIWARTIIISPGGKFNRYRYRAEGHNVLVINPSASHDQVITADTIINRAESNGSSSIAVADLTNAYSVNADSAVRGMKMVKNRSEIIVQDEVSSTKPMDIWWFMHTEAEISINSDGKSAVLETDGNKLLVSILGRYRRGIYGNGRSAYAELPGG